MDAEEQPGWQAAAASLVDWWVEAGVDTLVGEAPRDWLAPLAAAAPRSTAAPVGMPAAWADFAAWRHGGGAPEAGWPGGWVAASGPDRAELMVLADCPDRDDTRDGAGLLSGTPGVLFDRMLAAIGIERADIHLAAVCAKRPVAGRLPPEAAYRLAEIALHHVAVVRPKALLLIGNAASRAVLAMDARDARGRLHSLDHSLGQAGGDRNSGTTHVIASLHPRFLIERPITKADAWADLRMLKRALGR